MIGKITESSDNAFFLQNGMVKSLLDFEEREKTSRIMLNNLLVAYERSKLGQFLKAPF